MVHSFDAAAARNFSRKKRYKILIKKVRFFTCPKTVFISFRYFVCCFRGLALTFSSMMMRRRRRRRNRKRRKIKRRRKMKRRRYKVLIMMVIFFNCLKTFLFLFGYFVRLSNGLVCNYLLLRHNCLHQV